MDFRDPSHSADDIVFQGAHEYEPSALCGEEVLSVLARWQARDVPTSHDATMFQRDDVVYFTISYDGSAGNYWPNEDQNRLAEGLLRDHLFRDGICSLKNLEPRLIVANYKMQALADTEYMLVCPYPTESGNIAGLVVVCVNHHLTPRNAAG